MFLFVVVFVVVSDHGMLSFRFFCILFIGRIIDFRSDVCDRNNDIK